MGEVTGIQWTDSTFNPWVGCTRVSPGCRFCYAEALDHRWGKGRWGKGAQRERTKESYWKAPIRWNAEAAKACKRHRVFCASLADVFDSEIPKEWRADLFNLILRTPNLDWQLLTKRPQNVRKMLPSVWGDGFGFANVWIGTSVENQVWADKRIPILLKIPASVRFLSAEPLLGPLDLRPYFEPELREGKLVPAIHWVIIGGESGPHARPFNVSWARDIVKQCKEAGVSVFMKQLGSNAGFAAGDEECTRTLSSKEEFRTGDYEYDPKTKLYMKKLSNKKGSDMAEFPPMLRVREFPATALG